MGGVDLENMKAANDVNTQQVGRGGDLKLKIAARALAHLVPPSGRLFNLGGDEFVILVFFYN